MAAATGRSPVAAAPGLAAKLAEKLREANALRGRLLQTRHQTQHLRVRLLALGVIDARLVPGQMAAGSGASTSSANVELRSLLEWLAETVDLTQQVTFECGTGGAGVAVGGRRVLLQKMSAMPLLGTGAGTQSKLQLSVPQEMHADLAGLLARVRARGVRACDAEVARIADAWELVGAEMVSVTTGQPEPAIFLVRRPGADDNESTPAQAMVVAQWPSVDFEKLAAASAFDPMRHFQRLETPAGAKLAPEPPAGRPQDAALAQQTHTAPPPQLEPQAEDKVLCAGDGAQTRPKMSTGDRVVIKHRGHWCRGVLQRVDAEGNFASVVCDAGSPEASTTVPLASMWPAASPPHESQEPAMHDATPRQVFRHVRAKTVG